MTLRLERPSDGDSIGVSLEVLEREGAWTPRPCVAIESGNGIELTAEELEWLIRDSGPRALARLREVEDAAAGG